MLRFLFLWFNVRSTYIIDRNCALSKVHLQDSADGYGYVYLPDALAKKYLNASRELARRYVLPTNKV